MATLVRSFTVPSLENESFPSCFNSLEVVVSLEKKKNITHLETAFYYATVFSHIRLKTYWDLFVDVYLNGKKTNKQTKCQAQVRVINISFKIFADNQSQRTKGDSLRQPRHSFVHLGYLSRPTPCPSLAFPLF